MSTGNSCDNTFQCHSKRGLLTQGCYFAQEVTVLKVELKEEDIQ